MKAIAGFKAVREHDEQLALSAAQFRRTRGAHFYKQRGFKGFQDYQFRKEWEDMAEEMADERWERILFQGFKKVVQQEFSDRMWQARQDYIDGLRDRTWKAWKTFLGSEKLRRQRSQEAQEYYLLDVLSVNVFKIWVDFRNIQQQKTNFCHAAKSMRSEKLQLKAIRSFKLNLHKAHQKQCALAHRRTSLLSGGVYGLQRYAAQSSKRFGQILDAQRHYKISLKRTSLRRFTLYHKLKIRRRTQERQAEQARVNILVKKTLKSFEMITKANYLVYQSRKRAVQYRRRCQLAKTLYCIQQGVTKTAQSRLAYEAVSKQHKGRIRRKIFTAWHDSFEVHRARRLLRSKREKKAKGEIRLVKKRIIIQKWKNYTSKQQTKSNLSEKAFKHRHLNLCRLALGQWNQFMNLLTLKRQRHLKSITHHSLVIQRRFFPVFEAYRNYSREKKSEIYFGLAHWASRRYHTVINAMKSFMQIQQGERELARRALSERQSDLAKDVMRQWLILGLKRVEAREKELVSLMLPPPPRPRQTSWDPPTSRQNKENAQDTIDTPNLIFAHETTPSVKSQAIRTTTRGNAKHLTEPVSKAQVSDMGKENHRPAPRQLDSTLTKLGSTEDTVLNQSDTSLLDSSFSMNLSCSMAEPTDRSEPTYRSRSKPEPVDRLSQIEQILLQYKQEKDELRRIMKSEPFSATSLRMKRRLDDRRPEIQGLLEEIRILKQTI